VLPVVAAVAVMAAGYRHQGSQPMDHRISAEAAGLLPMARPAGRAAQLAVPPSAVRACTVPAVVVAAAVTADLRPRRPGVRAALVSSSIRRMVRAAVAAAGTSLRHQGMAGRVAVTVAVVVAVVLLLDQFLV
jgi:hypothetical protein